MQPARQNQYTVIDPPIIDDVSTRRTTRKLDHKSRGGVCGDERSHSRQQRPQNRLHNPLKHVVSTHIHNCAHTVGELRIRAKQVTRHTSNLKMRRVGVIMPVRRSHRRCRCRAARVQRAALEPEALAPAEVLANDVYIATHPAQIRRHRARRARLGARGLTRRSRARAPSRRGRRAA